MDNLHMTPRKPEKKCWIQTNKTVGILWFNKIKEALTDSLDNPTIIKTDVSEVKIQKASLFEIILLKYILLIGLIYIFFNVNTYYVSMLGMAISISLFTIYKSIYNYFGKNIFYISLLPIPISYLLVSFFWFEQASIYSFGFVFNYVMQYSISFILISMIVEDIAVNGYENYYKAKGKNLRYLKISDDQSNFNKQKKKKSLLYIFWGVMGLLFFFSFVLGFSGVKYKYNQEQAKVAQIENLNNNDEYKIEYLNKKADRLGMEHLHENIKGIQDYEVIELVAGTILKVENPDGTVKEINYGGKPQRVKAYIQDNRWKFKTSEGNTYTVMNGRAR